MFAHRLEHTQSLGCSSWHSQNFVVEKGAAEKKRKILRTYRLKGSSSGTQTQLELGEEVGSVALLVSRL